MAFECHQPLLSPCIIEYFKNAIKVRKQDVDHPLATIKATSTSKIYNILSVWQKN